MPIRPQWRHRAAREIQRADVRELVQAVALRGAPIAANRLRALLHIVFAFAIEQEMVEANPVTHVPRPGVERRRDRVLSAEEIRCLWAQLDREAPPMSAAFRLRLITAQRGSPRYAVGRRGSRRGVVDDPGRTEQERTAASGSAYGPGDQDPQGPAGHSPASARARAGRCAWEAPAVRDGRAADDSRLSRA